MASVPTGTTFYVGSTIAAAKPVTTISNASEAVVSCVAHGYSAGDIVILSSGWGRINQRAFKVKSPTTDTFVLEGQDTTNASFYPNGTGGGSVQKVTALTQITQVLGVNSSGGDAKNVEYKYLENDAAGTINDGFSATSMSLDLDADSIGSTGYTALKSLTELQSTTVIKTAMRNGSFVLRVGTVALNEDPSLNDGQVNKVKVAVNGTGRVTRYAS